MCNFIAHCEAGTHNQAMKTYLTHTQQYESNGAKLEPSQCYHILSEGHLHCKCVQTLRKESILNIQFLMDALADFYIISIIIIIVIIIIIIIIIFNFFFQVIKHYKNYTPSKSVKEGEKSVPRMEAALPLCTATERRWSR